MDQQFLKLTGSSNSGRRRIAASITLAGDGGLVEKAAAARQLLKVGNLCFHFVPLSHEGSCKAKNTW